MWSEAVTAKRICMGKGESKWAVNEAEGGAGRWNFCGKEETHEEAGSGGAVKRFKKTICKDFDRSVNNFALLIC